jgi:probable HAF family extracellular repeat protein
MLRSALFGSSVLAGLVFFACGDEETTGKTTNPTPDASTGSDADAAGDSGAGSDATDAASEAPADVDAGVEAEADAPGPALYEVHLVQQLAGMPFSAPLGMNESGQVVGYAGDEAFSPFSEPVRVDPPATLTKLTTPSPNYGFARGIVDDGSLIVGEYEFQGAYWQSGAKQTLAAMPGFFSTAAWDVNESGLVVGTFADHDDPLPPNPVGPRPCYWSTVTSDPASLQTLDGEPNGIAFAVNDSGAIAGTSGSSKGFVAVRWPSASAAPEDLGHVAGAVLTEARAISSNGNLAGRSGFQDGTGRAFWLPAGTTTLVALPNLANPAIEYAEAFGVNASGLVVGTATTPEQTVHAVGWLNGAIFDFNDQLVAPHPEIQYLQSAVAVSDTGLVAAEAVLVGSVGDTQRAIVVLQPK